MNWTDAIKILAFLILIGMLGYFLFTFKQNVEMFKTDPLKFAIKSDGYDQCICIKYGETWKANATDIWMPQTNPFALK